jgi:hypothetical protein
MRRPGIRWMALSHNIIDIDAVKAMSYAHVLFL